MRTLSAQGWLPNWHGAWAMVIVPPIIGILISGPRLIHIPLLFAWLAGYAAFFAFSVWTTSRRRRAGTPLAIYTSIAALTALICLALDPWLAWWALPIGTLSAIGIFETLHKRSRSLLSGLSTILAACLLTTITASAGQSTNPHISTAAITATIVIALYFLTNLIYIKTLIRKRGAPGWLRASISAHIAAALVVSFLLLDGLVHPLALVLFVLLAVKSWLVPYFSSQRSKPFSPKFVGKAEIPFLLAAVAIALI